ncbi:MAG: hypothetical protein PHY48_17120 [Candidatus Cloacimonetes bacterium]|jgi:PleD family two-component response regulator|nr:hypothetical protein [Candidatus Cloacimonadota bacterium]
MCEIKDLVILVVDGDDIEAQKTCDSLESIGVQRLLCVKTYEDAVATLTNNPDIDIVLADFSLREGGTCCSPLLCSFLQKERPSVLIILTSKEYTCSIVMESWKIGAADILHISRENEIQNLMEKWLVLAQARNDLREIWSGKNMETGK